MDSKTQLITIDGQQKICYFQGCKVKINKIAKCLLMEPEADNVKVLVANFDKAFYRFKNILCILDDETNVYNFMLITRNEKICEKAFNAIQKEKSIIDATLSTDRIFEKIMCPVINGIQENQTLKEQLMPVLAKLLDSFDDDENQKYYDYLKENGMNEQLLNENFGNVNQKVSSKNKKITPCQQSTLDKFIIKEGDDYGNTKTTTDGNNQEQNAPSRKRKRTTNKDKKNGTTNVEIANGKPRIDNVNTSQNLQPHIRANSIIEAPNFEIITFKQKNFTRKRLFIFRDSEKKYCYEYFWNQGNETFRCGACEYKNKNVTAKLIQRKNKDAVEMGKLQHMCDLREYKPEKYNYKAKTVEAPNFKLVHYEENGVPKTWLYIFPVEDRSKCYEYGWEKRIKKYVCRGCVCKNKRVTAELCEKEDGTAFVKLGPQEHICKYRKYNPTKFTAEKIVEASKFETVKFEENGISKQRLFIFANVEKTKCYEYYFRNNGKYFTCSACEYKDICTTAKIEEKVDGTKFVRLVSPWHVCEPKDYDPDRYLISKQIVEKPNFEVIDYEKNGISKSMLIIFCPTNKQLCYEYFWDKASNCYTCCGCANIKHLTAKISQRKDGSEYLKLNKAEHVCDLRPYMPEKFNDIIIHPPNYIKLDKTVNGNSVKRLFIFNKSDQNLCYMMNYDYTKKLYYCRKCLSQHQHITASEKTDENGQEYLALNNNHICEPIEYIPKAVVKKPDYQLLKRKSKQRNIVQKLVIFASADKKFCYEYIWEETYFRCLKCAKQKVNVTAKLAKIGDEEFIELCRNEHKCKPIKYVPEGNLEVKIVKEPNFKLDSYTTNDGIEKKFLSIFLDIDDKTKSYIYNWRESTKLYQCYGCRRKNSSYPSVVARLRQDKENDQSYVVLCDYEHICEPVPYKSPTHPFKTIEASKFKVQNYIKNGCTKQDLMIYASEDKKLYYSFMYDTKNKDFRCRGCDMKKVRVFAKLKKNVNGDDYLELSAAEHVCKPRKF